MGGGGGGSQNSGNRLNCGWPHSLTAKGLSYVYQNATTSCGRKVQGVCVCVGGGGGIL